MAKEMKIKIGVEIDQGKAKIELDKTLKDLQKNKVKIGFDIDTKALNSLKKTLEGFKNIKIGVAADTKNATNSTKNITNSVKQTNEELNKQKQIYSELKRLQNEEYSIKKKMIGASGEYKATLDNQLSSIKQQQTATRSLLTEGSKTLTNKEKETQLTQQIAKKENDLAQARAKANTDMDRAINKAKQNIDSMAGKGMFSTKEAEAFKKQLDDIDRTNMNHVREEISRIGQEANNQANKIQDLGKDLENIGSGMISMGESIMAVFALPTAGLVASVKTLTDFQYEMSKVQAVSQASSSEFLELEETARKFGRETMWSAKESAEALKYMGKMLCPVR